MDGAWLGTWLFEAENAGRREGGARKLLEEEVVNSMVGRVGFRLVQDKQQDLVFRL